jgi:Ca-activated chloride channel family protein
MLEDVLGRELAAARRSVVRNVELVLAPRGGLQVVDVPGRWLERRGDTTLLHLADLQPGMTTRAWVQLRPGQMHGGATPGLTAEVRWRRVEADEVLRAEVDAPFLAVADTAAFEASRDEAVFSQAVTALGSVKLAAASAAYERGDEASALNLLGNARSLFGMSADALAGTTEVDRVQRDFSKADPSQRKALARGLERKLMGNFGKENEGY